jgi:hypothetical protein
MVRKVKRHTPLKDGLWSLSYPHLMIRTLILGRICGEDFIRRLRQDLEKVLPGIRVRSSDFHYFKGFHLLENLCCFQ